MGNKGFSTLLTNLGIRYSVKLFIMIEMNMSRTKALRLVRKFNFDSFYLVEGAGVFGVFGNQMNGKLI